MIRQLDASTATPLGLSSSTFAFGGGWLSISSDASGTTGSAFDFDEATSRSRSLGETIERRVVWRAWDGRVPALEAAIHDGRHASAFAFSLPDADLRARRELEARRARSELWHGLATAVVVPSPGALLDVERRTGRRLRLLAHPWRTEWLGMLSEHEGRAGVLYSDASADSPAERMSSAIREHLMLLAAERLGVARVPRLERRLDDVTAWLGRDVDPVRRSQREATRRRRHRVPDLGWVSEAWTPATASDDGVHRCTASGWIPW